MDSSLNATNPNPSIRPFRVQEVPLPKDYPNFVLPSLPLDVDIGGGDGAFALAYAQAHPERFLVSIERTRRRFFRFRTKLNTIGQLDNLLPVHTNAIWWITHHLPANSVQRYFCLYPNPYPKKRQANRRWHRMPFFARIVDTLCLGGELTVATNIDSYAQEALAWCQQFWGLKLLRVEEMQYRSGNTFLTQFEMKYLARGLRCQRMTFVKTTAHSCHKL